MKARRVDAGQRLRFELGMELAAEKPGMLRRLDDLYVLTVGRAAVIRNPASVSVFRIRN